MAEEDINQENPDVINPTEEESTEDAPTAVDNSKAKAKTSRLSKATKQKLLALGLVLIAIVVTAFILLSGKATRDSTSEPTSTNTQEETAQETSTVPRMSYRAEGGLQAIGADGQDTQLFALSDNQVVIGVKDALTAVATLNDLRAVKTITVYDGSEQALEFEITDNNPNLFYGYSYHFESNTFTSLFFDFDTSLDILINSYSQENPDGTTEYTNESQSNKPILVPLVHTADGNIVSQAYSCVECDGPPLVEFWTIDVSTNSAELSYKPDVSSELFASFSSVEPGGKRVYVSASDVPPNSPTESFADSTYYVYEYEVANSSGRQVFEQTGAAVQVAGFSDVANEIFITRSNISEEEAESNSIQFEAPVLARLNIANATARDLKLTLSRLNESAELDNVLSIEEQLYFRIKTFDDSRSAVVNYSLDLSESGDGKVVTLSTLSGDNSNTAENTIFANSLQ